MYYDLHALGRLAACLCGRCVLHESLHKLHASSTVLQQHVSQSTVLVMLGAFWMYRPCLNSPILGVALHHS